MSKTGPSWRMIQRLREKEGRGQRGEDGEDKLLLPASEDVMCERAVKRKQSTVVPASSHDSPRPAVPPSSRASIHHSLSPSSFTVSLPTPTESWDQLTVKMSRCGKLVYFAVLDKQVVLECFRVDTKQETRFFDDWFNVSFHFEESSRRDIIMTFVVS